MYVHVLAWISLAVALASVAGCMDPSELGGQGPQAIIDRMNDYGAWFAYAEYPNDPFRGAIGYVVWHSRDSKVNGETWIQLTTTDGGSIATSSHRVNHTDLAISRLVDETMAGGIEECRWAAVYPVANRTEYCTLTTGGRPLFRHVPVDVFAQEGLTFRWYDNQIWDVVQTSWAYREGNANTTLEYAPQLGFYTGIRFASYPDHVMRLVAISDAWDPDDSPFPR